MKVEWYNRDGRFTNGVRWFRFNEGWGWGLWWRDSRIAGPSRDDAPGRLYPFGPYRWRILTPGRRIRR